MNRRQDIFESIGGHAEFDLTSTRIALSKTAICARNCPQAIGRTISANRLPRRGDSRRFDNDFRDNLAPRAHTSVSRSAGQEDGSQRDIEREGGMVASPESAAHIGKQGFYVRRLARNPRVAEHVCKRFSGLVRRLHAEHELEVFGARVVPGEPAFSAPSRPAEGNDFSGGYWETYGYN